MSPKDTILPLFGTDAHGRGLRFLGTGCFVEPDSMFLTADHVVRDWGEAFCVAHETDKRNLHKAVVVWRDQARDLALLNVESYRPLRPIPLATGVPLHPNQLMLTYEFGTTRTIGGAIHLGPATRVGNITRAIDLQEQFGLAGLGALELSFPALQGASGAPVVSNEGFRLYGVIIANVNYHLLPCQIESVLDESNKLVAETQFMMPQGLAVNVGHVAAVLEAYAASRAT